MLENYLLVDIDKIKNNIKNIKNKSGNTKFCAVLKADAYGLGAETIAKYIENDIDYIAVAKFDEALKLRKSNIKKPILILGYVPIDKFKACIENNIDVAIYDLDYAKEINDIVDFKLNCHLALDTGHTRLGFRDYEIEKIKELKKLNNLNFIAAFSHFSTADEKDINYTKEQLEKFDKIIDNIKTDFNFKILHIANSAATIKHKIYKDMVRVGISLYGIYPSDYLLNERDIDLEKVFELKAQISLVKEVKKDTTISYGRTYTAKKDMKVATVALGYADGFHRAFSNKATVLVNGKASKLIGRICMDQFMIDVSGIDCKIGDYVSIYPDIYKEANKIDTITYELMTSISKRVPRVYKYKGEILGDCYNES